jgi:hypothetical protein
MLAVLTALLRNDLFQTTLAALLTKGVGSLARIFDDRHAPDEVRKKTEKREGLLLMLTTGFTALADTVCSRQILPHVQKALKLPNLGNYKKLLMIPPIVIGYALSEVTCRLIAPKTPCSERMENSPTPAPSPRLNILEFGGTCSPEVNPFQNPGRLQMAGGSKFSNTPWPPRTLSQPTFAMANWANQAPNRSGFRV